MTEGLKQDSNSSLTGFFAPESPPRAAAIDHRCYSFSPPPSPPIFLPFPHNLNALRISCLFFPPLPLRPERRLLSAIAPYNIRNIFLLFFLPFMASLP